MNGNGGSPSLKRESRPTLSTGWKRHPEVVHCGEQDHTSGSNPSTQADLTAVERFERAMWAARNLWDIERHRRGTALPPFLRKHEAERALRAALKAALVGERA